MRNGVGPVPDLTAPHAPELAGAPEIPLFKNVDPTLVRSLAAAFELREYEPDTLIVESAEWPATLQLIHRGIVELCSVDDHGDEVAVLLLAERDAIAPAAAVLHEPSLICARALTKVTTLELDAELIREAMPRSATLTFNLLKIASGQWRMAVRAILDLGSRSAAQRLGSFLLRLADISPDDPPVLPIAKRHLAARIAVAPETLSRTLQIVADNGLYLRGRAIIVKDRARIEAFCGPDPYPCRDERDLGVFAL